MWLLVLSIFCFKTQDDVISGENGETIARFVQKDGVRYVDIDAFADTFKCSRDVPTVTLPGGTERFARLDDVRHMATGNKALTEWLAVVDSLPK